MVMETPPGSLRGPGAGLEASPKVPHGGGLGCDPHPLLPCTQVIWPTHTLTQSLGYESLPEFFSEGLSLPGQPSPNT